MPGNNTAGPNELKLAVSEFFSQSCRHTSEGLEFDFKANGQTVATEFWNAQGSRVPESKGFWKAANSFCQPREVFIAFSATDILCFCNFYTKWLRSAENVAFVAVGTRPKISMVNEIKEMFPSAKVHLLFDNDLIGRLTDCKIAVWLGKGHIAFELIGNDVRCKTRNGRFQLDIERFSLYQFCKISGFRTTVRTHKPNNGHGSFYNLFTSTNY